MNLLLRPACPYCKARPRYGLDKHKQVCSKRPVVQAFDLKQDDSPPSERIEAGLEREIQGVACPKCDRPLKKQGAHFHIRACKGKP